MIEFVSTFWTTAPLAARLFVGFLLAIAGAAAGRYLYPLYRLDRRLKPLQSWLDGPAGRPDPASRLEGEVLRAWKQFQRTWERHAATLDGEKKGMVSPEEHFRSDLLLAGIGRAIPQALPGIFAGIGILGTFLGIVLGLSGIEIGTADTLMASVEGLLAGMSTAFISSIVGIFFSVGWLLVHRWLAGHVEARLVAIRDGLGERYPAWDSASVLRFSLETQQRQVELEGEQKAILQNLGTDISEAMETALAQTLNPALSELSDSFQGLAQDIRGQQAEGMGELAEEFRKQLMGSVQSDFERLSESLSRAADIQDSTATHLTEFMTELDRVAKGQTELLNATTEAAEQFSESVDGLTDIHQSIGESVPAFTEAAERTGRMINDLKAQSDVLGEANASLREALAEQLDAVDGQVRTLVEFWDGFSGSLEDFREELQESISEFRNMSAERLAEVFQQFDREMARVVEHLSGTLAEVREVSEALPEGMEGLHASVNELGEPLAEMAAILESSRSSLDDHSDHMERLQSFVGSAQPLETKLTSVGRSADALVQSMGSLESAIAQLSVRSRPPPSIRGNEESTGLSGDGRA